MKTYKAKIKEFWFGGVKERTLEVQARTDASAMKKVLEIQGNRDWEILEVRKAGN